MRTPTDGGEGTRDRGRSCLSDEAIEESAAQAAFQKPLSTDVEKHLAVCACCRDRFDAAQEEARFLRKALGFGASRIASECLSDEDIALYLDQGSETDRRVDVERHLARCATCQGRMTSLYDEVQAFDAERAGDISSPSVSLSEARERLEARKPVSKDGGVDERAESSIPSPAEEQADSEFKRNAGQR